MAPRTDLTGVPVRNRRHYFYNHGRGIYGEGIGLGLNLFLAVAETKIQHLFAVFDGMLVKGYCAEL